MTNSRASFYVLVAATLAYLPVDERRKHLVEAAIHVIASEGLSRTTTRRIAQRAGVPLGVLHYCFKNKGEILQAVVDEGAAMIHSYFNDIDPTKGLRTTIEDGVATLWKWYQENLGLQLALTEMGLAHLRRAGSTQDVYGAWGRFGRDLMISKLNEARRYDDNDLCLPVEAIARFILHRFDGLTLEFAASRDIEACQAQVDLLCESMLRVSFPR